MRPHNIPPCYRKIKEVLIMSPDLALLSTLIGLKYPCLELILMVPKMFEPFKFECIYEIRRKNARIWPLRKFEYTLICCFV